MAVPAHARPVAAAVTCRAEPRPALVAALSLQFLWPVGDERWSGAWQSCSRRNLLHFAVSSAAITFMRTFMHTHFCSVMLAGGVCGTGRRGHKGACVR